MCLFKCGNPDNSRFFILFSLFIFIRKSILLILKKFEGTLITTWLMLGGELLIGLCNIIIEYKKLLNIDIKKILGIPIISNKKSLGIVKALKFYYFYFVRCLIFYIFFL